MSADEVRRSLSALEQRLAQARATARRLVDDANDWLDQVILASLDSADGSLTRLAGEIESLVYDVMHDTNLSMENAAREIQDIVARAQRSADQALTSALIAARNDYYAMYQLALQRMDAEIEAVVGIVQALTNSCEALISLAASSAQAETKGILDGVTGALSGMAGSLKSYITATAQAIGDLVDPVVLGLSDLFKPFFKTVADLLSFDAEGMIEAQMKMAEAWKKRLGG